MTLTEKPVHDLLKSIQSIVFAYEVILGTTVKRAAERHDVPEKFAAQKMLLMRKFITDDDGLFRGPKGMGLLNKYPPKDDPVWPSLYKCYYECPTNKVSTVISGPIDPNKVMYMDELRPASKIPKIEKLSRCTKCPFSTPPYLSNLTFQRIEIYRQRGTAVTADNFRELFYLADIFRFLQNATIKEGTKFPIPMQEHEKNTFTLIGIAILHYLKINGYEGIVSVGDIDKAHEQLMSHIDASGFPKLELTSSLPRPELSSSKTDPASSIAN